jgi:hypothetical protein
LEHQVLVNLTCATFLLDNQKNSNLHKHQSLEKQNRSHFARLQRSENKEISPFKFGMLPVLETLSCLFTKL